MVSLYAKTTISTWFWFKSSTLDKPEIPNKDYKLLLSKLKPDDLNYLISIMILLKKSYCIIKKIEKGN
jgi:hypothetical protein